MWCPRAFPKTLCAFPACLCGLAAGLIWGRINVARFNRGGTDLFQIRYFSFSRLCPKRSQFYSCKLYHWNCTYVAMASKTASKGKKEPGKLTRTYLFLYNFLQVIGWFYLLLSIVNYYLTPKKELLWENVQDLVLLIQNAAFLEIAHAAFGLVSSNVVVTTFQVMSRVLVVNGVLIATPTGAASPGVPLALTAWSFAEIIRYLFYALNIMGSVPHLVLWLRYTGFIILYPLGITGELLCLYAAQTYVATNNMWSIELPNYLNFTFSYRYFLLFAMSLYIPLFPMLYMHMIGQRRKALGAGSSSPKKTK